MPEAFATVTSQVVGVRHQDQVLPGGQQVVHRRELPGHPDRRMDGARLGGQVMSRDARPPAVRLDKRGQDPYGRRLPV